MSDFTLRVEDADVLAALRRVAGVLSDPTPLAGELAALGESSTRLRFRTQTGPDGVAWKQSLRAKVTGGRTLTLPASFKALGGSDTAIASAAGAKTVLSAKTFDGGTSWVYAMQEVG